MPTITDVQAEMREAIDCLPLTVQEVLNMFRLDPDLDSGDNKVCLSFLWPHLNTEMHTFLCWAVELGDDRVNDLPNMDFPGINPFATLLPYYKLDYEAGEDQ